MVRPGEQNFRIGGRHHLGTTRRQKCDPGRAGAADTVDAALFELAHHRALQRVNGKAFSGAFPGADHHNITSGGFFGP